MGNLIVDVGGGTTETALISMGGVVALEAVRSVHIDTAIHFIKAEYGVAIGERTAEQIKLLLRFRRSIDEELRAEGTWKTYRQWFTGGSCCFSPRDSGGYR